ncbi:hypothetical protein EOPP23_05395 [Endozoicomonas sp. OPT23]|nr:hypothetical protein [Endozoicomonas sp. OPT23]
MAATNSSKVTDKVPPSNPERPVVDLKNSHQKNSESIPGRSGEKGSTRGTRNVERKGDLAPSAYHQEKSAAPKKEKGATTVKVTADKNVHPGSLPEDSTQETHEPVVSVDAAEQVFNLEQYKAVTGNELGRKLDATLSNEASKPWFNYYTRATQSLNHYESAIYNAIVYRVPVVLGSFVLNLMWQRAAEGKTNLKWAAAVPVGVAIAETGMDAGYVYWPDNIQRFEPDTAKALAAGATAIVSLGGAVTPAFGSYCSACRGPRGRYSILRFFAGLTGGSSNVFWTVMGLLHTPVATDILKDKPSKLVRALIEIGKVDGSVSLIAPEDTSDPLLKFVADHKRNETAVYKYFEPEDNPCLVYKDRSDRTGYKESCEFADRVEGLYQSQTVSGKGGRKVELLASDYGLLFEKVTTPKHLTRELILKALKEPAAYLEASDLINTYETPDDLRNDKFEYMVVTISEDRKIIHIGLQVLSEDDEQSWWGFVQSKLVDPLGSSSSHVTASISLPAKADLNGMAGVLLDMFGDETTNHVLLMKVSELEPRNEGADSLEGPRVEL